MPRGGRCAVVARRAYVGAAVAAWVACAPAGWAIQTGITGFSGKTGDTCNDSCHSGGTTPLVRFEGPARIAVGSLATFRFVVVSQSTRQLVAGFNVAASEGTLDAVPGHGERVEVDELTHELPKASVDGSTAFTFIWRSPEHSGGQTLYGAGLSANNNANRNGDDSATATLAVSVTPSPESGDANCDARFSAADLAAALRLFPAAAPPACALADVDGDGVVNESDVGLIVASLFEATDPVRP